MVKKNFEPKSKIWRKMFQFLTFELRKKVAEKLLYTAVYCRDFIQAVKWKLEQIRNFQKFS